MNYDAIVIGAGHNGLSAAASLARKGRRVAILEKREEIGGLAAGSEFHPGYRTRGLLLDTSGVRRRVVRALDLESHGLSFRDELPVFIPQTKGPGVFLHRDPARMTSPGGTIGAKDHENYRAYRVFLGRIRGAVRSILDSRPIPITDSGAEGFFQAARMALRLRLLGRDDMQELLRIGPMCAADWLGEQFENDLLKAGLAAPALEASMLGPRSAGTTLNILLRECAAEREVEGGPAALIHALASAAKAAGVDIRTKSPVARIRIANGKVVGVATEDGRNFDAPVVAAACDPKTAFFKLIDPVDLPVTLEEVVRVLRQRGTSAKVNLALSGPLEFAARPGERIEAARTGENLDELERAFDAAKYREFSKTPQLEIRVPTVSDPSLAPAGHEVVEILAHFAPHNLKGGWTDQSRKAFGDAVVKSLARYAPSAAERIVGREVLVPTDIEERYGLSGGHLHHGEHFLDQLYSMRPNADCAGYATPVRGLFLCGSGSHPGGGLTCQPGKLAAEAILAS